MNERELIAEAHRAQAFAYAKYSGFAVGAALLCGSGKVYRGCNVENASLGATVCAERTAFLKALSEGERDFAALAIVGGKEKLPTYPCGICRQFMAEWNLELKIILEDGEEMKTVTLSALLPDAFIGY